MSLKKYSVVSSSGNFAYLLIFFSSCFPSSANILYMIYRFIVGTLYPTYLSYKALKRKDDTECTRLMIYWIIFSIFSFLETFLDLFIGFWLPFYYESKIIFIYWLISPFNGARVIYENLVNKKLEENEQAIDTYIKNAKRLFLELFWILFRKCSFYLQYLLIWSLNKIQSTAVEYVHNQPTNFNLKTLIFKAINDNQYIDDSISTNQDELNETCKQIISLVDSEKHVGNSSQLSRQISENEEIGEQSLVKKPMRNCKKKRIKQNDQVFPRLTRSTMKNFIASGSDSEN